MQANELFIQPNTILLDGGMGTMLQAAGLKLGARPEELKRLTKHGKLISMDGKGLYTRACVYE